MDKKLSRRRLLAGMMTGLASGYLSRTSNAIDYIELPEKDKGLTANQAEHKVWIRWQNRIVTVYRAHPTQIFPYLYPLNGRLSGASLTSESGLPYPHHRSLFLGCHPVNGGNYWASGNLEDGQIVSRQLKLHDMEKEKSVSFSNACSWIRNGHPSPLKDSRHFTAHILNDRVHLLDCQFTLTALNEITITRAKHSLFVVKVAYDLAPIGGGTLLNSEGGNNAEGTYGKPARWCCFYGRRHCNPQLVEGITIMNHPDNFGKDCPWLTRNYGHLSPSPFNFLEKPWKLSTGNSLTLNYCVVLHAGNPDEVGMDKIYQKWLRRV